MESGKDQAVDVGYEIPTWNNWSPLAKFYHPLQAGSIDGTDTVPHDRAVSRATLSKYKPNKRSTGDPHKTLFVGKLTKDTTEDTVYKVFAKHGEVIKCRLVRDVVTGFSRGYAFVEYRSEREATTAWRELHKEKIDGNVILVEYEAARTLKGWIPRRLGGGFGGKKESGQLRFGGRDRPFRRPIPTQDTGNRHKYLRGSRDHENAQAERENQRESERTRAKDASKFSENHRESYGYRERERERDGSRENHSHRDRDRESSRSGYGNREREGTNDGSRYRERESERYRDGDRELGGERYRSRERYGDGEVSRSKGGHGHRERRREGYDSHDKRKETFYRSEMEMDERT